MSDTILDVRNLMTQFQIGESAITPVNGVSFSVRRGEILGLVGESGSGKSITAFSVLRLVDRPGRIVDGEVLFRGENILRADERRMRELRGNRISMVFQDPMMTLNPVLRIDTQMIETLKAHGMKSKKEAWIKARDTLGMVGIPSPDERMSTYPHQLSGGMRQRVAIAIALLNEPDLLIADEPTTALDVTIQAQILAQVQHLAKVNGTAMLWITHDLSVISGLADRLAVMYAGRIVEQGSIATIISNPGHRYTEGLLRSLPNENSRGSALYQIPGMTPNLLALPDGCAFRPRCAHAGPECTTQPELKRTADGRHLRCFHPAMDERRTVAS